MDERPPAEQAPLGGDAPRSVASPSPPSPRTTARGATGAHARRLRARRQHRAEAAGVLLAPSLALLSHDIAQRGLRIVWWSPRHFAAYVASFVGSAIFWAVLVHAASGRRGLVRHAGAALFIALYGVSVGVQLAFRGLWGIYASIDGLEFAGSVFEAITAGLPLGRLRVLTRIGLAFGIAVLIVWAARRVVRPRRRIRLVVPSLVPVALVAAACAPVSYRAIQSTTAEFIYFHGLLAFAKARSEAASTRPLTFNGRRTPLPVPKLTPRPSRPRNVLLLIQEAERADVTCVAYEEDCRLANQASNKAAPGRMPLLEMRSNASSTAVSLAVLSSGLAPTESREALHSAPLLWEYAHAAGYDTAYYTSQHVMFANMRLFLEDIPASHFAVATNLDGQANMFSGALDAALTKRVIAEWADLKEPFLVVVEYANIHTPRVLDKTQAPFQPMDPEAKELRGNTAHANYYKNVVYLSDLAVGALIEHVRKSEAGARTIILHTSDHGESFREHDQGGDHSHSVFDEELRVPTWIDAPAGTLSPEEEASIRAAREELLWHIDVAPTVLDLLGVWDDPSIAGFRAKMLGHPITRPERTTGIVPLTNVSWVWEVWSANWGLMQGPLKVLASSYHPADRRYRCYDVKADPLERTDLGVTGRCAPLVQKAERLYHVMPVALGRLSQHPEFGQLAPE